MNREEIEKWLKKYSIKNYTIHENLVVDVGGDVNLHDKKLKVLPFQFGKVTGYFYCHNNQLTSLQYCPTSVNGWFTCSHNQLTSLQYCPTMVGGDFYCANNQLTSLQYCPTTVGGDLYFSNNPLIVTKENEKEWFEVIKNHKEVYSKIKEPTEELTLLHKILWEV